MQIAMELVPALLKPHWSLQSHSYSVAFCQLFVCNHHTRLRKDRLWISARVCGNSETRLRWSLLVPAAPPSAHSNVFLFNNDDWSFFLEGHEHLASWFLALFCSCYDSLQLLPLQALSAHSS